MADAVQQKRKLIATNDGLHDRIGAALHFQHGPDSKALIQFGLKPRVPRRKSKPKAPPETPSPPTTPLPAAAPAVSLEAEPPAK